MSSMTLFIVILGMAVVTFLPRFIPVLLLDKWHMPAWVNGWLRAVPYAALGALIFPGILLVNDDQPLIGLAGGIVAALLAYFRLHILFVIVGSIGTVMILNFVL